MSLAAGPRPTDPHFGEWVDVPVLELSSFSKASAGPEADAARRDAAKSVAQASTSYGSFWVKLDGFSAPRGSGRMQQRVTSSCHELFAVPASQKRDCTALRLPGSNVARGYIAYGSESGSPTMFENKEGFSYGFSRWEGAKPSNDMEGYNVWPSSLSAESRRVLEEELFDCFVDMGAALVRAYSLALYDDEMVLADAWKGGETLSLGRIFRYFNDRQLALNATQRREFTDILGSSPHTDWGLLTLIMADDTPGLQLWLGERYRTVLPRFHEDLVFVNCGDFMSILSQGRFLSPLHRVVSPPAEEALGDGDLGTVNPSTAAAGERLSVVFFYYPNYDAKIPTTEPLANYSVFQDQALDSTEADGTEAGQPAKKKARAAMDKDTSFGAWIREKWDQVARAY